MEEKSISMFQLVKKLTSIDLYRLHFELYSNEEKTNSIIVKIEHDMGQRYKSYYDIQASSYIRKDHVKELLSAADKIIVIEERSIVDEAKYREEILNLLLTNKFSEVKIGAHTYRKLHDGSWETDNDFEVSGLDVFHKLFNFDKEVIYCDAWA